MTTVDSELSIAISHMEVLRSSIQALLLTNKIPKVLWPRYLPELSESVYLNMQLEKVNYEKLFDELFYYENVGEAIEIRYHTLLKELDELRFELETLRIKYFKSLISDRQTPENARKMLLDEEKQMKERLKCEKEAESVSVDTDALSEIMNAQPQGVSIEAQTDATDTADVGLGCFPAVCDAACDATSADSVVEYLELQTQNEEIVASYEELEARYKEQEQKSAKLFEQLIRMSAESEENHECMVSAQNKSEACCEFAARIKNELECLSLALESAKTIAESNRFLVYYTKLAETLEERTEQEPSRDNYVETAKYDTSEIFGVIAEALEGSAFSSETECNSAEVAAKLIEALANYDMPDFARRFSVLCADLHFNLDTKRQSVEFEEKAVQAHENNCAHFAQQTSECALQNAAKQTQTAVQACQKCQSLAHELAIYKELAANDEMDILDIIEDKGIWAREVAVLQKENRQLRNSIDEIGKQTQ